MMLRLRLAVVIFAPALVGCSNIQGTWVSKGATETPANPIGRVTFANDGTFTAEADYGQGGKRAMSGTYDFDMMKGKLDLEADGQKRAYDVAIKGDEMTISKSTAAAASGAKPAGKTPAAPAAPHKFTMTRMPGKSMWKM